MINGVEQQLQEDFMHEPDRLGLGYEIDWVLVERETTQVIKKERWSEFSKYRQFA